MFSVNFICSSNGSKFQTFWVVLRLSPGPICVQSPGRHRGLKFNFHKETKIAFSGLKWGFRQVPELHVLHAAPQASGYSHLGINSVDCRRLHRGIITVECDHCVISPNKAVSVSWWAVGCMGWKCFFSSWGEMGSTSLIQGCSVLLSAKDECSSGISTFPGLQKHVETMAGEGEQRAQARWKGDVVLCSLFQKTEQNDSPEEDFAMRFSGFGFGLFFFSWEKRKSQFGLFYFPSPGRCVFLSSPTDPCFTETSPDTSLRCLSAALLQIRGCQGVFLKQERWELPLALAALPQNTLSGPQCDVHKLSPSITAE